MFVHWHDNELLWNRMVGLRAVEKSLHRHYQIHKKQSHIKEKKKTPIFQTQEGLKVFAVRSFDRKENFIP